MKNYFKIIVFLISVFLLMSCVSEKYSFENKNISIKSNIKENHQVIDNKKVKLEGMYCLASSDDLKRMKDNFSIIFDDEKLQDYNFQISFNKEPFLNGYNLNAEIFDLDFNGVYRIEFKNSLDTEANYFIFEKKIRNGYIIFGNRSISDIKLKFLFQKFNEIEIIEKFNN